MGHAKDGYIKDYFSHAELVRELRIEAPFAKRGEMVADSFWTKAVASFESDPKQFERDHACPILKGILEHDKLINPSSLHDCHGGDTPHSSPDTACGTGHDSWGHCDPAGVPEPSSLVLSSIAIVAAAVFCKILGWPLVKSNAPA